MKKLNHRKRTNSTIIKIENEREVISTFFWRSMEALRFMAPYDAELKTTILEKAIQYFGVKERSVQDHIDKVLVFDQISSGGYYR